MMAQIHSTAGSIAAAHKHASEQITWVISGRLRCIVGEPGAEQTFEMGPGDVLMVPGFVPHATETIEDTYRVDVRSPPRTAWAEPRRAQEAPVDDLVATSRKG